MTVKVYKRKEEDSDYLKVGKDDPLSFDSSIKRMDQKLRKNTKPGNFKTSEHPTKLFDQTLDMKNYQAKPTSSNASTRHKRRQKRTTKPSKTPKTCQTSTLQPVSSFSHHLKKESCTPKVELHTDKPRFDFSEIFAEEFSRQKREIFTKPSNYDTSEVSSEESAWFKYSTK